MVQAEEVNMTRNQLKEKLKEQRKVYGSRQIVYH